MRIRRAKSDLSDVTDTEQLVAAYEAIGAVEFLKNVGRLDADDTSRINAIGEYGSVEEARQAILDGLFKSAKMGDSQAARAWNDISSEKAPVDRFNLNVNIMPYTIADPSLKSIMLQSELPVVDNALEGLDLRMEIDEAPHELRALGKRYREEFAAWATEAYAPKDA